MAVTIRPLGIEALDLLAELHRRCFAKPWDAETFAMLLTQPRTWALGADAEGGPVGFVLLRAAADQGEILSIGVVPEARGAGRGSLLMDAALQRLAEAGAASAFLEVADDNADARTLYARLGFEEYGRRPGYYDRAGERRTDALILRRALN